MTIADDLQDGFGYLHKDDLEYIRELASTLPENPTIVNIGAGTGTSGIAFLETRKDATVCTVDIEGGISSTGGLGNEEYAIENNNPKLMERRHGIKGDSKTVGAEWDKGFVDMIFIDGDHSYLGCRGDIEAWLPHLKDNGVLALHDYAPTPWKDVVRAVKDCLEGRYELIGHRDTVIAYRKREIEKSTDNSGRGKPDTLE